MNESDSQNCPSSNTFQCLLKDCSPFMNYSTLPMCVNYRRMHPQKLPSTHNGKYLYREFQVTKALKAFIELRWDSVNPAVDTYKEVLPIISYDAVNTTEYIQV